MAKIKTSIVIPAYNGLVFLTTNLSLVKKIGADEIIVVDDASVDGTSTFVKKNYPEINLLTHISNTRFPISVNDGFKIATGDVVVLLNQDVSPDHQILAQILPHFSDPKLFAVTFNEGERSWADARFKNGFIEFSNGSDTSKSHQSFWPSGGSAAFRKSMWNELGGFAEVFTPGYFEDFDIGWRANLKGWYTLWDPKAKVNHAHPESTFNSTFPSKALQRIKDRNYLIAHWRNLTASQFPTHLIFLLLRIVKHPGYIVPTLQALQKLCLK